MDAPSRPWVRPLVLQGTVVFFLVLAIAGLRELGRLLNGDYVPRPEVFGRDPFIVEGSELRGIYGNNDVCAEVFCYRTSLPDFALAQLLRERAAALGFERVTDVDGAMCFRKGGQEVRVRHDVATGTVFVGQLGHAAGDPAWADRNVWSLLR